MTKIVAVLTAYNEAMNVAPLLAALENQGVDTLVVDDGSTDKTAEVARHAGADVVRHRINLGQGYALITGFKAALARPCDVIVEMDADGQHDPAEIPVFIQKLAESDADIVVGSRILGENHADAPLLRRAFLPHVSQFINILTGYNMTDAMCGFRAFRADALARVAPVFDNTLEPQYIAAEMFIRFSKAGLKIDEVPIHMKNRTSGHSHKGLFRYGFGVLRAAARAFLDSGRPSSA